MKFSCSSSDLYKACSAVRRTVSNKSAMPALECIFIRAFDGKISLTGYDLEVGTQTEIEADVIEDGRALLNASHLCEIIKNAAGDTVNIDSDDRSICKIRSGASSYRIIGVDPDDFPELPTVEDNDPIIINQGLLKDMIARTIFSVSVSERNPVHTGVKFEIAENELTLISVDGSRLSVRKEKIEYSGSPISFVVPAKALHEISRLSTNDEENFVISTSYHHICIKTGEYQTTSRLLEGNFIDYKATVPQTYNTYTEADTQSLIEAIERTALIITDRTVPVKLKISGGVFLFSSNTSVGTAEDVVSAKIDGSELEIGFNPRFLLDALKAVKAESVLVNFVSATKPIVILPTEGENFLFLVLPVRM